MRPVWKLSNFTTKSCLLSRWYFVKTDEQDWLISVYSSCSRFLCLITTLIMQWKKTILNIQIINLLNIRVRYALSIKSKNLCLHKRIYMLLRYIVLICLEEMTTIIEIIYGLFLFILSVLYFFSSKIPITISSSLGY